MAQNKKVDKIPVPLPSVPEARSHRTLVGVVAIVAVATILLLIYFGYLLLTTD